MAAKTKSRKSTTKTNPGTPSNRKQNLHLNSCSSKNGCHEVVKPNGEPATEQEITDFEQAGGTF